MKFLLPYSSKETFSQFLTSVANENFSVWRNCVSKIWECFMDFNTMVESLGQEYKAYRPTWGEGELLWKQGNVLVHNTPYWSGEQKNQMLKGYPYVCETCDVEAKDWILVKDEQ